MRERGSSAGLYAAYAAASLILAVAAGVWLRWGMLDRSLLAGFGFRHAVHAHSHLAFFGWATPALFAYVTARGLAAPRWHAHAVGIASFAAFFGFLDRGYDALTIGISVVHVLLWALFVYWSRDLAGVGESVADRFLRAALYFLGLSGLAAVAPALTTVVWVADPWTREMAVELFLTPFTAGWLALGALAIGYGEIGAARFARPVLFLTAVGVVPSAAVRVIAEPPAAWVPHLGRLGAVLLAAAALLFAVDVLRHRSAGAWLRLAGAAALVKGVVELVAVADLVPNLPSQKQLVVAYLHLVLLGLVTPLLIRAVSPRASGWLALAHGAGLALMLAALAFWGWPGAGALWARFGVDNLLLLALAGGAVSAVALTVAVAPALLRRSGSAAPPARAADLSVRS